MRPGLVRRWRATGAGATLAVVTTVVTLLSLSSSPVRARSSATASGCSLRNLLGCLTTTTPAPQTTTTSTLPLPPPTCANQQTLVADGNRWTCTFDAEFTGTSYDHRQWVPITTAGSGFTSGNTACFVDSPNNISVANGHLSLTARREAAPFTCQDPRGNFQTQETSGQLSTYGLFSQAYGRFEINAQVPSSAIKGLQTSLWLFPQNETKYGAWPASGEIDIAEVYSQYPTLAIPYIHYNVNWLATNARTNTNTVTNTACTITPGAFHDYVVEWTPTSITMIYDGTPCLIDHWVPLPPLRAPQPFDQPFFINLTQALGISPNTYNSATTPLPATTEVKYVRAWMLG